VSTHALRKYGIQVKFAHADTTAFSLEGVYAVDEAEATDSDEAQPITITYGHSKDHRPDLKQAILSLICADQSSIPVYLNALSGNTADKTSLPQTVRAYLEQFGAQQEMPTLVVDSALYSANTVRELSDVSWVTRVPATITEVKTLLAEIDKAQLTASEREGYFYHELASSYGDVPQRWLVVLYEPRQEAEQQRLDKQIAREREQLDKQLKQLQRQAFNCAEDAQRALRQVDQQATFHTIRGGVDSHERYAQRGRPTPDSPVHTDWYVQPTIAVDDAAILRKQQPLGKCQATAESALPIYGRSALERNGSSALTDGTG